MSFENNSQTKIPNRTDVIPSGWSKIGDADSAISFDSSNKRFTTSVPGLYFINFSGSYGNGTPVGNYEYRILKNGTRVLAFYGSADVSSRSGSVVVSLETTDYINLEYYQSSGSEFIIRQSSFNVVSFLRIV